MDIALFNQDFDGTIGINYESVLHQKDSWMKSFFRVIITLFIPSSLLCTELCTIKGIIQDALTNEPLIYANVSIEGTSHGTTTDALGKFFLILPQGSYNLRCSYIGYQATVVSISVPRDVDVTIRLFTMDMLLQDVTVYAYRKDEAEKTQGSALSLQSEKMKTSTSTVPDVLRSVQMLPGVSTNNEFSAKFNVRGGNQDENLVLVNGTQVYDPFHVKEAPNASIGIFNMDMINNMDLITGGFPARYGDRMSSVVNIEYREGNRERFEGTASLSMTDVNTVVEGPLGDNGSFILGGRKSYFEYMLKMLDFAPSIHPSFYDVQGVVGYSISPRHKVALKFIHAGDNYSEDPQGKYEGPDQWYTSTDGFMNTERWNDSTYNRAQYYSTMIALQSINILSSSALIKTEFSFYDQRENEWFWHHEHYDYQGVDAASSYFYTSESEELLDNSLQIRTLELNTMLDMQIAPLYGMKTGVSYQSIGYRQDQIFYRILDELTNQNNYPDTTHSHRLDNILDNVDNHLTTQSFKVAGYVENIIQFSNQFLLNIGARFDYFDLNKDLTWSPRFSLAYRTGRGITFRGAWGHYYQSPIYRQIANPVASDTNTQSQHAIHYVLGADYDVMMNRETQEFVKVKVEGYYKLYDNLITATQTSDGMIYYTRKNDATGIAKGIDVYIAYSYPGFYGWLSYGLLTARQKPLDSDQGSFPRNTDQRHTVAAVGDVGLGSGWSVGTRLMYGSGYPYTPMIAVFNSSNNSWNWVSGAPNSEYLPSYSRADVRITKDFYLFGKKTSAFIDVSNVFNTINIQGYSYRIDRNGMLYKEEVKLWPIIPSLGITVQF